MICIRIVSYRKCMSFSSIKYLQHFGQRFLSSFIVPKQFFMILKQFSQVIPNLVHVFLCSFSV